jgi:hypothetical protein
LYDQYYICIVYYNTLYINSYFIYYILYYIFSECDREDQAAQGIVDVSTGPHKDMSLKEGEKIKVKIGFVRDLFTYTTIFTYICTYIYVHISMYCYI